MEVQDITPWLERTAARQLQIRNGVGATKLAISAAMAHGLSAPRRLRAGWRSASADNVARLQQPWFPLWPGLAGKPVHDPAAFAWTAVLRRTWMDIRAEMVAVQRHFQRAAYDSDINDKPWNTYYFYLRGRALPDHLRACPRTAAALAALPTNRLHVCFSAIQPNGSLAPHTGPTNTSLTVHLGLANCAGARLFVADQVVEYRDGEVLVFDDSYLHWVEHGGKETRCTLMITIWHPGLSRLERAYLDLAARLVA
jgi:aspartate beta-hydroxylase